MSNLHHNEAIFNGTEHHFPRKGIEINICRDLDEGMSPTNSYGARDFRRISSSTSINSVFDSHDYYSDNSHKNNTTTSSSISTPFLLTIKENSLGVEELNILAQKLKFNKTIVILVGLPASGKSTISKQLCGFLELKNYKAKIYNAGDIRRKFKHNSFNSSDFFDPKNLKAKYEREIFATTSLSTLLHDLDKGCTNVGFLDATNTTLERRNKIIQYIKDSLVRVDNVIIMDIQCTDENLFNFNISGKAFNADYVGKDYNKSVQDFKERSKHYIKIYDQIGADELASYNDVATCYVKIVNGGKEYKFTNICNSDGSDSRSDSEILAILNDFVKNYPEREGKRYFEAVDAFYKNKPIIEH